MRVGRAQLFLVALQECVACFQPSAQEAENKKHRWVADDDWLIDPEALPAFGLREDDDSLVFAELYLSSCESQQLPCAREDVEAANAACCDPGKSSAQQPAAKSDERVRVKRKRPSR